MSAQKPVYDGFVIGPNGNPHNVQVAFDGPNTYIADQNGQSANQFWQQHNHYVTGGYDGQGGKRGHYTGPGA